MAKLDLKHTCSVGVSTENCVCACGTDKIRYFKNERVPGALVLSVLVPVAVARSHLADLHARSSALAAPASVRRRWRDAPGALQRVT